MPARSNANTVFGRDAQVDICPCDAGFVLSVGRVSIWLERPDAEDLVETLARALQVAAPVADQDEAALPAVDSRNDEPN